MEWKKEGAAGGSGSGMPGKKKGPNKLLVVIAAVIVLVVVRMVACSGPKLEKLEWPTTGLAAMLPQPNAKHGSVISNSDKSFSASLDAVPQADYDAYIEACKEKGFAVEAETSTGSYIAYNEEGYKLWITYYSSSEDMSINLDAPVEMGALAWPTSGAGALVPAPQSQVGKISTDSSTYFAATVGETDSNAYSAYVDSCISAGFNVDYTRGDTSYSADDASGNHINVSYKGMNTMSVTVNVADEPATAPEAEPEAPAEPETPAEPEAPAEEPSEASDFRAWVDEYEAFMNSYVDFMLTYKNSSNPVAMAVDYAKWMADYADWAQQAADLDESSLSVDDVAYFNAAQARVLQRLSEVQ